MSIYNIPVGLMERASGAILYVNTTGSGGAFTNIQDAINASLDGDAVFIYSGTYNENVFVNKTINLIGENRNNTIIDGGGLGDVIYISEDWINITGFTITNSGGTGMPNYDAGIELDSINFCQINDNNLFNNWAGICLSNSENNTLINNNISYNSQGIFAINPSNYNIIINNTLNSNNPNGIYFTKCSYNKMINNSILENRWGIRLASSSHNIIINNNVSTNTFGIRLDGAKYNMIGNNTIHNNGNVMLDGEGISFYSSSNYNTIRNNDILSNVDHGIYIDSSSNNTIIKNDIKDHFIGIRLVASSYNNITHNHCSLNNVGIRLQTSSKDNIVRYNNVSVNNADGISLWDSSKNYLSKNIVISNSGGFDITRSSNNSIEYNFIRLNIVYGIQFSDSSYNNITKNDISSNKHGIDLDPSSGYNQIKNNNINHNNLYGIYIDLASNNKIYHNNFIENTNQAQDNTNANLWNDTYPSGGNYWSDYYGIDLNSTEAQNIPPPDGIGDSPYIIDSDSQDNFPLIRATGIFLNKGWNLISIPVIQLNTNLSTVLSCITDSYDSVQWYNVSDIIDQWKQHHIKKPSNLNDLNGLNHTMGFWIHITELPGILFEWQGNNLLNNQTIQLYEGWNMVGYPSLSNHNRTAGLSNLEFGTDIDVIQWYDTATKTWHIMDQNDSFVPGRGYWMHSKVETTWEVPM
jgi:parallel beta-helix repeat protein